MAESTLDKFYNKLFPARGVLRKAAGTAAETKPAADEDTSVVRKAAAEAGERMEAEKRKKKPAYEDDGIKPNMLAKPKK
jgi:hypothetical protein